jgi:4-hydroxy-tetrahydrodipicolinate synthase
MNNNTSNNNETMEFPDGTYTVLVTPFRNDDTIDIQSFNRLLEFQYESPVTGLVLLGTTSEGPTLDFEESVDLVKYVYNYNKHQPIRKFIVVGVGGNCTRNVLKMTSAVADYCDALMVTVPNYNKPQQRGVVDLYQQVYKYFPHKPVMIYNIPGRTGLDMEPESMIDVLKTCPNVTALKEASGNYVNVAKLVNMIKNENLRNLDTTFKLFSGDDVNVVKLCRDYHGRGLISVASNIVPHYVASIVENCIYQNFDNADKLLLAGVDFLKYLFVESNPVPVKEMLFRIKLFDTNKMRRPLMELDNINKINRLKDLYKIMTGCDDTVLR